MLIRLNLQKYPKPPACYNFKLKKADIRRRPPSAIFRTTYFTFTNTLIFPSVPLNSCNALPSTWPGFTLSISAFIA